MTSSSNRKRKILILSSYTLPDTAGSGIHAFRFARFINRIGDKATILTFNRNCRLPNRETIENVPVFRIPYFNKGLVMKILSLPIVTYYYILFILKNEIVFIYGGRIIAWELFILFSKLFHKKVVFRSLLTGVDDMKKMLIDRPFLVKNVSKALIKRIDCYYSINKYFTEQYLNIFHTRRNILEIPQGVDRQEFFPVTEMRKIELRKQFGLPEDSLILISAGLLIRRKGYIELFRQLTKLSFEYKYIVLGDHEIPENHFLSGFDSETFEILNLGKNLLKDRITFLGFRKNIAEYLQCSDLMLINSYREGLPNVLLEAMACGIPVITRNLEGLDNFVIRNNINSLIYNKEEEIPGLVSHLYYSKKIVEKLTFNAIKDIESKYSFEKIYSLLHRRIFN